MVDEKLPPVNVVGQLSRRTSRPSQPSFEAMCVSSEGLTVTWPEDPDAHFYWIEIAADAAFTRRVPGYGHRKVLTNSAVVTGLEPATTYFIRVRPEYEQGPGRSEEGEVKTADLRYPTANHVISFPGEGGLIELGEVGPIAARVPRAMTVEAWVWPEPLSELCGLVSTVEYSEREQKGWYLGITDRKPTFGLSTEGGTLDVSMGTLTSLQGPQPLKVRKWQHIAATYDGKGMRLYLDGQLQAESRVQSGPINYPLGAEAREGRRERLNAHQNARFVIGAMNRGPDTLRFRGKISEVRLWREARSEEALQASMQYRLEPQDFDALVGNWRCDTGAGVRVKDFAGDLEGTLLEHAAWADGDILSLYRPVDRLTKVVSGLGFYLGLREDGSVWSWGSNQLGRLGDGTLCFRAAPVPVRDHRNRYLRGIKDIAAGAFHGLALHNDGRVFAWGANDFGQLGDGSLEDHFIPSRVVRVHRISAVAAGAHHSLALDEEGSVWAWGSNRTGQLGIDGTENQYVPSRVKAVAGGSPLGNIKAIAGGHGHSLALSAEGQVYFWGSHDERRVELRPLTVRDEEGRALERIEAISAQHRHSLALNSLGQVHAWGRNDQGQLGLGHLQAMQHPTLVRDVSGQPLSSVSRMSAGYGHNLVVKEDGSLWAWGSNRFSELKPSHEPAPKESLPLPVPVLQPSSSPGAICAGYHQSGVTDPSGRRLEWGQPEGERVVAVAAGRFHAMALLQDGTVRAWGQNGHGQLGVGTTDRKSVPMQVRGPEGEGVFANVRMVAGGSNHSLGLLQDGTVWAFGKNTEGALGNDSKTSSWLPLRVYGHLTQASTVAAGEAHSVALDARGRVWTWGYNADGCCGDGTWNSPVMKPQEVLLAVEAVDMAAGWYHTVVLLEDGTVWTFGNNWAGALGDGTTKHRNLPVQVECLHGLNGLRNIAKVAAGHHTSFALTRGGTVYAWGYNNYGQLGNNSNRNSSLPVLVRKRAWPSEGAEGYLEGIVKIVAGAYHVLALAKDGTVWAWGCNRFGQLGNNSRNGSVLPVKVKYKDGQARLSGIVDVAAGEHCSMALQDNGRIWTWGRGALGLLANGSFSDLARPLPDRVAASMLV